MTQGDPLAMILYGILLLPLIWQLRKEFGDIFQPWYADDGAAMARIPRLLVFFDRLVELDPPYGYFPEKLKSILIVNLGRNTRALKLTASHPFHFTNGSRYLGE